MPAVKTPAKAPAKTPVTTPAKAAAKTTAKSTPNAPAKAIAKPPAAAPKKTVSSPAAAAKPPKVKAKLVRDSFTMPQSDFDLIAVLKARAIEFKRPAKKSELLRAGLQALSALNDAALRGALDALAPLKPGRPKKAE